MTEETGYTPLDLELAGYIEFYWQNNPEWNQKCYLFRTSKYTGELTEGDECLPKWFSRKDIPWEEMWEDDKHWFIDLLDGKEIKKRCYFDKSGKMVEIVDI